MQRRPTKLHDVGELMISCSLQAHLHSQLLTTNKSNVLEEAHPTLYLLELYAHIAIPVMHANFYANPEICYSSLTLAD